jgi:hypothetical protein
VIIPSAFSGSTTQGNRLGIRHSMLGARIDSRVLRHTHGLLLLRQCLLFASPATDRQPFTPTLIRHWTSSAMTTMMSCQCELNVRRFEHGRRKSTGSFRMSFAVLCTHSSCATNTSRQKRRTLRGGCSLLARCQSRCGISSSGAQPRRSHIGRRFGSRDRRRLLSHRMTSNETRLETPPVAPDDEQ